MAAKLSPKMTEALEHIDAYGTAGIFHDRTLKSLINRGLIENAAGAQGWNYRVTENGAEVYSRQTRGCLGGRFTVQPVTFAVGDLVNYSAMPLPEPFRVTAVVNGLVETNGFAGVPSSFVKVAEPAEPKPTAAQKLARLQAETPRHECGLSSQGIDCMCADAAALDVDSDDDYTAEFGPGDLLRNPVSGVLFEVVDWTHAVILRNVATDVRSAIPASMARELERVESTDVQGFNELVDEADPAAARREREATTADILVDDAAADRLLNALYADGPAEVFHLVRVRFLAGDDQVMRVEGTTPGPVGTLVWLTPVGDDLMPVRPAFPVAAGRLFRADVTALCHHAYTVNDSCPNCDEEDGQTGRDVGRHALLTELGFATMVERRPDADGPGMRVMPVGARDATYLETRR